MDISVRRGNPLRQLPAGGRAMETNACRSEPKKMDVDKEKTKRGQAAEQTKTKKREKLLRPEKK